MAHRCDGHHRSHPCRRARSASPLETAPPNSRTKKETFLKAIHADWQPAQLFILKQCHTPWCQTRQAITGCDEAVRKHMAQVPSQTEEPGPTAHWRNHRLAKNDLQFDVYQEAYRYYGVDLSTIDGILAGSLTIHMSELGNARDILGISKTPKPSPHGSASVQTTASPEGRFSNLRPGGWSTIPREPSGWPRKASPMPNAPWGNTAGG